MSHADLVDRLLILPDAMQRAELDLLAAEEKKRQAEFDLQAAEDELVIDGVEGKNETVRSAMVRVATRSLRLEVERAVQELARLKINLHLLQSQHSSLRAVSRLLMGQER